MFLCLPPIDSFYEVVNCYIATCNYIICVDFKFVSELQINIASVAHRLLRIKYMLEMYIVYNNLNAVYIVKQQYIVIEHAARLIRCGEEHPGKRCLSIIASS